MSIKFLYLDKDTNKPSTAKIWRHIAFGIITWKVWELPEISYEIMLAYFAGVAGIELGQRFKYSRDRNKEITDDKQ